MNEPYVICVEWGGGAAGGGGGVINECSKFSFFLNVCQLKLGRKNVFSPLSKVREVNGSLAHPDSYVLPSVMDIFVFKGYIFQS